LPTAELVRQILGAVAQFEKAALVANGISPKTGGAECVRLLHDDVYPVDEARCRSGESEAD